MTTSEHSEPGQPLSVPLSDQLGQIPVGALTDGEAAMLLAWAARLAAQRVAAERERCAKLVETMDTSGHDGHIETTGDLCEALAGCIRRGA